MGNSVPIVVVVDDTWSVRSMFERSSASLNIELETFGSAAESMSYLATTQPELLFLDNIMPEKDGLTFLQQLRNNPLHRKTPVERVVPKLVRSLPVKHTTRGAVTPSPSLARAKI